ncbi:MAG: DUF971 domain-containing protein [Acidobacteriota bacterium]
MSEVQSPSSGTSSSTGAVPALIGAHRDPERRILRLVWQDGHEGEHPYDQLRGWCPCAACQGHGGTLHFQPPRRPVQLESLRPVGRYALSMLWSDGHGTGIYDFEYLRQLCPCEICENERGGPPNPSRR